MLAQFALIVFALCGVLSLVIDVGYARLSQGQMQNAADMAALEGARGAMDPAIGRVVADPLLQRTAANRLAGWVFDDDLNSTNGDPDYQFGAGPIVDLTDGVTDLQALQTLSVPDPHVYKPDLQLNQQNVSYGDMVSGRFCYSADPGPSEDLAYALPGATVCGEPQNGGGSYARNDFNPGVDDSAFLVRLRRSNEFRDLDGQTELDVASSGPSLPLTFGKATTIASDSASAYSPRRDGLTTRATAIAGTRPALHVGLPQPSDPNLPGVTPFALVDTFARRLSAVATQATINPATGVVCSGLACVGANPATAVGRFVDALTDPTRSRWKTISTVGQALPAPVPVACALANTFTGYGPVYSLMSSGGNRIIGFAQIVLVRDPARAANPCAVVASRGEPLAAAWNATANLLDGLPLPASAQPADVAELLDKNLERNGVTYGPVLVAVLAR